MKEQWKVITMIIVLILVVVFALQNTSAVAVDLIVVTFQVPLVLVILFSLLVGVIVGLLTSMAAIQSNRKDNTSLTKEIDNLKRSHQENINEKEAQIRELREEIEQQRHVATYEPENMNSISSESDIDSADGTQANEVGSELDARKYVSDQKF